MSQASIKNKIASLQNKHKALDNQLNELYKHNSVASSTVTDIKKQKLDIKDQITKLENTLRSM